MVLVLPMYEIEQAGLYYNTAAVIDADGTYLGKFRKQHIPQVKGFWEKFYFRPGNGGYPVFDTAVGKVGVYICYDRHFPEGWRALGLNGAEIVFNPSATHRGLSEYIWRIEQPAAAVANMYYVGAINRVGIEADIGDNDFYGQSYFVDPEGKFVGDVGDAVQARADRARPRHGQDQAGPRPLGVLPRPPPRRLLRTGGGMTDDDADPGRHDRQRDRSHEADVLIDGETIVAVLAPGQAEAHRDRRRCARSTRPASTSCPGGVDVHTHMELPFGGTSASDTFETGTIAAAWGGVTTIIDFAVQRAGENVHGRPRRMARQGRRQLRHRLRLPPDHRRRRRGVAEGDDVPRRQRGHHQLQAVHGLPGRLLHRRRPDPAGDAERRRVRGGDDDARRERHRHRRARSPRRWRAARPIPSSTRSPVRPRSRARRRTGPSSWPRWPATCRSTSCTCRRREALEEVAEARHQGQNVFAETCPQYLYLSIEDQLAQPGFEGAKWVCSTPLRSKHEHHHRDLWKGLRMNELAVVSTDHCPFCMKEQKELGLGDFSKIPNGIGGVEHRMELLYQGVVERGDHARALGRDVLHHTGADVRPVPAQGRDRPGRRRRHRRLGPERARRRSASTTSTT